MDNQSLEERFSPSGTQAIDVRGLDLNRPNPDRNKRLQDDTDSGEFQVESIMAGVEALSSDDGDRPETIDAINVYIARNADKITAEEVQDLEAIVKDRRDGDPEKRRQALEAIRVVREDIRREAEYAKQAAETKKVDQTSRLMDTWQKEIAAKGNEDGVDVMKKEFGSQLDKWASQIDSIASPEADQLRARIAQARTEFLRGGSV